MREVVAFRANRILGREQGYLDRVDTLSGLDRWRVAVVQRVTTRRGAYGCELGSLASELADHDEDARVALARHFASWEALLVAALERMRDKHVLRDEADPRALATGIMASLQGGYLLAQMAKRRRPDAHRSGDGIRSCALLRSQPVNSRPPRRPRPEGVPASTRVLALHRGSGG